MTLTVPAAEAAPYCAGERCADCTPGPEGQCCETTCGCCPAVSAQDWCFLRPGQLDDTWSCAQHDLYDILRNP